jgi:hypothetical protein
MEVGATVIVVAEGWLVFVGGIEDADLLEPQPESMNTTEKRKTTAKTSDTALLSYFT